MSEYDLKLVIANTIWTSALPPLEKEQHDNPDALKSWIEYVSKRVAKAVSQELKIAAQKGTNP